MATAPMNTDPRAAYTSRGASLELAEKMVLFARHMREKEMQILIYCVYRSNAEQAKLYALGRTAPGRRVTNARPGASAHNRIEGLIPASDAFDACPLIDGRPTWDTHGDALPIWNEMGDAAIMLRLQWGRNYDSLGGDWAHFEYQRGMLTPKGSKTA
jgi:peptidoglycan L-alanyl-D-glutamate endopeptidase CwlK